MKKIYLLFTLLIIVSCNNAENERKEKIKNDSITQANLELKKRATFTADSIKHITDSIKHITDSIAQVTAKLEHIKTIKSTIRVTSCYLSSPNSASGCDANFYYVNKSGKTIKYLVFDASFKNNVGDLVTCDIRNEASFRGKDTGPVKDGRASGGTWDCVIYNWSAKKLIINSINIEYMEGGSITVGGEDLKLIGLKDNQINI